MIQNIEFYIENGPIDLSHFSNMAVYFKKMALIIKYCYILKTNTMQ